MPTTRPIATKVLYNDSDPFCCEWLRALIEARHLPTGDVWCRRIERMERYADCETIHWFAGIGGWALALEWAGWPRDRPVWTGSCPCQPFSIAGSQNGFSDERHLWPTWLRIIEQRRPPTMFGEQVASKLGREWLAGVRSDLEALGYVVGASDLCAACIGAPHIRQRIWWVANLDKKRCQDGSGRKRSEKWIFPAQFILPIGDYRTRYASGPDESWLVDAVSSNVGAVRGFGNAIVPQVAAVFVRSFLEAECLMSGEQHGESEVAADADLVER